MIFDYYYFSCIVCIYCFILTTNLYIIIINIDCIKYIIFKNVASILFCTVIYLCIKCMSKLIIIGIKIMSITIVPINGFVHQILIVRFELNLLYHCHH